MEKIQWDKSRYFPGDRGQLLVTIVNDEYYEIVVCPGSLEFDFETSLFWDVGDHPIIASWTSFTYIFNFKIPQETRPGSHMYNIAWVDFNWVRGFFKVDSLIAFNDLLEPAFRILKYDIDKRISDVNNTLRMSIEDKALLQRLLSERRLGEQLAREGKWSEAITKLQTAGTLADEITVRANDQTRVIFQIGVIFIAIIMMSSYINYQRKAIKLTLRLETKTY
ncbi:MAG: hypothetical protein NTV15_06430 [Candidatus Bathyarchaeota archaeon]|nr:hypothetical protein [Candidatus Bathyarchaeota archaeon]